MQYVLVMAFSPCGRLLLTVSANEEHTIRIWDWKEKKWRRLMRCWMKIWRLCTPQR